MLCHSQSKRERWSHSTSNTSNNTRTLDYVPPRGSVGVVTGGRERQLVCDDVIVDWINWEDYRDFAFYRLQGGIYYNHKELQAITQEDF